MKSDKVYLSLILDAIRKADKFSENVSFEDFLKSEEKQSAIILQLAMIGELSKKISEKTKSEINLPWKEITGFRDKAVHDYYHLDLEIVWNTVKNDLQIIKKEIKSYINENK